ncbi:hypothetical protein L2A60_15980 [Acidiphilium iwatense]|uniref:Uncharacterized protein n=2 Tax=Acidiphilium iwatense TaxID=768198 RepID=A0ABS9DZP8_9PROT|nr:hypothetical protein [Acidiphilium iwatense]
MRWQQFCAAVAVAGVTTQCHAAQPYTKDGCFPVRGELSAWNGTPSLRITADNQTYGIVPSGAHPVPEAITKTVDFDHSLIGRFTVCRLGQAKPGGMTYVWVEHATNLETVPAP